MESLLVVLRIGYPKLPRTYPLLLELNLRQLCATLLFEPFVTYQIAFLLNYAMRAVYDVIMFAVTKIHDISQALARISTR